MNPPDSSDAQQLTPLEAWEYLYVMTQPDVKHTRATYANLEKALRILRPAAPASAPAPAHSAAVNPQSTIPA